MKILTRVLAVLIAFSALTGGAYVYTISHESGPAAAPDPMPVPSPSPTEGSLPPSVSPSPTTTPTASPSPSPPAASGKTIEISIARQELIARENGVVVYRFLVSTGRSGYETPAGRFKIHTKYEKRWSRTWEVWMPYAMFFHPKWGYAIHELPYYPGSPDKRIGASKLGTADSHGCIRVGLDHAADLYAWAPVGTPVWIH